MNAMMKVFGWMEKNEWFLICLGGVMLLRIPSLFEPYWYGDEGIYLAMGQALRKGWVLYSQIHDNKPPFLYLIAALSNGEIFWFKLWAGIFNLVSIGVFYKLARGMDVKKAMLATWVFALLTTLPFLEGNIANAENFFVLFTVGAFYILWSKSSLKNVFLGGVVLGLGALFKMPPMLEAGIWPIYWFLTKEKDLLKKTAVLACGVILPILLSCLVMWFLGAGKEYLIAAWAQNLPYLTSWKATSDASGVYSLKNRVIVLALGILIVSLLQKKWQKTTLLLALWTLLTWFASLLSGRPYPHYLLQMSPVIALLTRSRVGLVLGTTLLVTTWMAFQFYNYPTLKYYQNFARFGLQTIDRVGYWEGFGAQVKNNYEIAEKVASNTSEQQKIFVWGDEPMIYAAARRLPVGKYLAKYHINDFDGKEYVLGELKKQAPEILVIFDEARDFPALNVFAHENYYQIDTICSAVLWKIKK